MMNSRAIGALVTALMLAVLPGSTALAAPSGGDELAEMDLEALMNIEVTTVSKRSQKVSETPAAVFVISQEDIRRSGYTTVPDVLRMVPGVHVLQLDASHWAISARGFTDEFANKLLVMIDGRSIYTPLFSGTIWSEHELMLEDIDRIEVVRGPGGTMWGANAVNGVIHIITKSAKDTQGLLVSNLAGTQETYTGAARWGGAVGEDVHYRAYGKFADRDDYPNAIPGAPEHSAYRNVRTGGRVDWDTSENGLFTFQGDFYNGDADRLLAGVLFEDKLESRGGDVLARYTHTFSDSSDAAMQFYFDRTEREAETLKEERNVFDLDFQHSFSPLARNRVVWGAGYRRANDDLKPGNPAISFTDDARQDDLFSLFLQDELVVAEGLLSFTAGSKFEHNDYTGWEIQPSARLLLTPAERQTVWASVSRAVRTPSRSEEDFALTQPTGPTSFIVLDPSNDVDSEKLIAYELGYRTRPIDALTFDVAAYFNQYDDLHSQETVGFVAGPPTIITQANDNLLEGDGYGVEVASNWAVTPFLQLTGGYTFSRTDLKLKGAGADLVDLARGEDLTPRHQFRIASHVNLPWGFEFDSALGWTDKLKDTGVSAHTRLDTRVGYHFNENLELSVAGLNLIEKQQEFANSFTTQSSDVPRSVHAYAKFTW